MFKRNKLVPEYREASNLPDSQVPPSPRFNHLNLKELNLRNSQFNLDQSLSSVVRDEANLDLLPSNPDLNQSPHGQENPQRCPICLNLIFDKASIEPCNHNYCFICIKEWLKESQRCPVCRLTIERIIHYIQPGQKIISIPIFGTG